MRIQNPVEHLIRSFLRKLSENRNCLLLLLHSDTDEVTIKTLIEETNIDISHENLDRTHGIGKTDRNDGKSRPIIIKFARYVVCNNVYKNKKKLVG